MKAALGWVVVGALMGASGVRIFSGASPVSAASPPPPFQEIPEVTSSAPPASASSTSFSQEPSSTDIALEDLPRQIPSAPPHALPPLPMEGWSPDKRVSAALAEAALPPAEQPSDIRRPSSPPPRQAASLEKHARSLPGVNSVAWGGSSLYVLVNGVSPSQTARVICRAATPGISVVVQRIDGAGASNESSTRRCG